MLTTGCFVIPDDSRPLELPPIDATPVEYDVLVVKRQDFISSIATYGHFVPSVKETLYFKYTGGRVTDVYVETNDFVTKGQFLAARDIGGMEVDVKLKEIALEKARIRYELQQFATQNKFQLRLSELDVLEAEIRLHEARDKVSNATIVAPIDGEVTYVGIEEGDMVAPFEPVLQVVDASHLVLECTGENAKTLKTGMEVEVDVNNNYYPGTVTESSFDLFLEGEEFQKEDTVIVEVPDLPPDTEKNELGKIRIVLEESYNTIVVPKSAVHSYSGRNYVYVLRSGAREERDVEVGMSTTTKVEITEGLSEGDMVILR
jgi:RND family efflux transporter MFP subunit